MANTVRYDYATADELLEDRSLDTHRALKNIAYNDAEFGSILRNVMRYAFECGAASVGNAPPDDSAYESNNGITL